MSRSILMVNFRGQLEIDLRDLTFRIDRGLEAQPTQFRGYNKPRVLYYWRRFGFSPRIPEWDGYRSPAGKYFKIFIIFQGWFLLFLELVAILKNNTKRTSDSSVYMLLNSRNFNEKKTKNFMFIFSHVC